MKLKEWEDFNKDLNAKWKKQVAFYKPYSKILEDLFRKLDSTGHALANERFLDGWAWLSDYEIDERVKPLVCADVDRNMLDTYKAAEIKHRPTIKRLSWTFHKSRVTKFEELFGETRNPGTERRILEKLKKQEARLNH